MEEQLAQSAERVVSDLRLIAAKTSDEDGAQRIAWGDNWIRTREWFKGELDKIDAEVTTDSAGNIWAKVQGETDEAITIGSHLDSVYDGGWLDGVLGVVSGLEALRLYSQEGKKPKKTIYLVDWADEEGARFGFSTFGSSAASGSLSLDSLRGRKDRNGILFEDALKDYGIDVDHIMDASDELKARNLQAYLEMHIEQGPVLEQADQSVSAVTGIAGVKRHNITFTGQAVHAGSFPTRQRQDAFLAAAQTALDIRELALKYDAVSTVGKVDVEPGVVTIVPGKTTISLDQRTIDGEALEKLWEETQPVIEKAAEANDVAFEIETVMDVTPGYFDKKLIALANEAVKEETGQSYEMHSGPNHDAMEMSKLMPTVMLFAMSLKGISHAKEEDTPEKDIKNGVRAFLRLVEKIVNE